MQGAERAAKRAIVRAPGPDFGRGLTTSTAPPPRYEDALAQHDNYCAALEQSGLQLLRLPPLPEHPDAPFVEDTAVVIEEGAILMRPGAPSRREEVPHIVPGFQALGIPQIGVITAPGTVDGGDVLRNGRRFWIGLSARTNKAGADQLTAILKRHGFQVTILPIADGLHLKSSVTGVAPGVLLAAPPMHHHDAFAGMEIIAVPPEESYAANALWLGERILCPAGSPQTVARLEAAGHQVKTLEMSAFRKMDGALTCCSLLSA